MSDLSFITDPSKWKDITPDMYDEINAQDVYKRQMLLKTGRFSPRARTERNTALVTEQSTPAAI